MTKIIVACHNEEPIAKGTYYLPIHVGREISEKPLEMAGDNTGDNISSKNQSYCELTSLYWAWKNFDSVSYIGFCHYRRYFPNSLSLGKIEHYLGAKQYDIIAILGKKHSPIHECWNKYITADDLLILLQVIKKNHPEYSESFNRLLWGNKIYGYNIFIMKKIAFDKYATWLFSILEECEKYVKLSPYSRGKRVFGYMGELLLTLYIFHNHLRVKETMVVKPGSNPTFLERVKRFAKLAVSDVSYYSSFVWLRRKLYHYYTLEDLIHRCYPASEAGQRKDNPLLFESN